MIRNSRARRRWLYVILVVVMLAIVATLFVLWRQDKPTEPAVPPVWMGGTAEVSEDDPRWDCRTMGNRVCGPVDPSML